MEALFIAIGLIAVAYGLLGLYGLWRAPGLFSTWAYSPRMLMGRLPDNQANRTLKLIWVFLLGAYLAISNSGATYWSLVPFAGFIAATIVLVRSVRPPEDGHND
jgi:hypothetical protein